MALLLPLILLVAIMALVWLHRSRDRGLAQQLGVIERDLAARLVRLERGEKPVAGGPGIDAGEAGDALTKAPQHIFDSVHAAYDACEREAADAPQQLRRAVSALAEYRDFRGWKG